MARKNTTPDTAATETGLASSADVSLTPNAPGDDEADAGGDQQDQVASGEATVTDGVGALSSLTAPLNTAMYAVLTPFKFRGFIVKPPEFIELTAEGAEPYQVAGVLGTEPHEVPQVDAE